MRNYLKNKALHIRLGGRGENAAASLLSYLGYDVLFRNYESPRGEIDIVARDGQSLVFVEVKTLFTRAGRNVNPGANLGASQRRRIYRAALSYLRDIDNPRTSFRFDLIEVVFTRFGLSEIRHWKSNFGREGKLRGFNAHVAGINYF